jgi:hypothetical protein
MCIDVFSFKALYAVTHSTVSEEELLKRGKISFLSVISEG